MVWQHCVFLSEDSTGRGSPIRTWTRASGSQAKVCPFCQCGVWVSPSGPVEPSHQQVAPGLAWVLSLSDRHVGHRALEPAHLWGTTHPGVHSLHQEASRGQGCPAFPCTSPALCPRNLLLCPETVAQLRPGQPLEFVAHPAVQPGLL